MSFLCFLKFSAFSRGTLPTTMRFTRLVKGMSVQLLIDSGSTLFLFNHELLIFGIVSGKDIRIQCFSWKRWKTCVSAVFPKCQNHKSWFENLITIHCLRPTILSLPNLELSPPFPYHHWVPYDEASPSEVWRGEMSPWTWIYYHKATAITKRTGWWRPTTCVKLGMGGRRRIWLGSRGGDDKAG